MQINHSSQHQDLPWKMVTYNNVKHWYYPLSEMYNRAVSKCAEH